MSEQNIEAFKRAVAATNRGDVEAVLRELHPEVEFHAFMEELLGKAIWWRVFQSEAEALAAAGLRE